MGTPFLTELKCMSFGFAPKGWAQCNGQLLPINQNQAIFSLLGTTYGGDGRVNFGLPNLMGRTPMSFGNGHNLGEMGGEQAHTLTISEIPTHVHTANAGTSVATVDPLNAYVAGGGAAIFTGGLTSPVAMNPQMLTPVGGSQPHPNMQPFLVLNWCIALQGIFPSQN
jgi:microcystin-dependent protein